MMAVIGIGLCRDGKTGRNFRAVYLGREFVRSFWHLSDALICAKHLSDLSGLEIQSAEIVAFPKVVA